jgi:hypothetical protein
MTVILTGILTGAAANAAETMVSKPARVVSTMVKLGAIVEAVDKQTRELKLLDAQGNRFTVIADDAVRNFDQIEPRDRIIVEYLESVAVVIAPAGSEPPVGDADLLTVAPAGDKPGMSDVETRLVMATVHAINAADRLVTLETEDGNLRSIKVSEDAPLESVDVGDQVRVRITTAIAVAVVTPDAD